MFLVSNWLEFTIQQNRERSGSVVECLTRVRGALGSSLTGVTVLCPCARHINPSLVLVQPRKTHPFIIERLLMGRKESNQTNKQFNKNTNSSLEFKPIHNSYSFDNAYAGSQWE